MNKAISSNFSKLGISTFLLPTLLITSIIIYLYHLDALNKKNIVNIQKDHFLTLNHHLSQFPETLHNCTHLGDAMIFLSLLALFVIFAPKVWESLISASIISALFAVCLKKIFSLPRPAAAYTEENFLIVGDKLTGHNSFPSGHSITVFTILTVILFAFMPKRIEYRILWCISILIIGFILIITRIGVGAHYPLDVIVGAIVGYISGLLGIIVNQRFNLCSTFSSKKFYPLMIAVFITCIIILIIKILETNLIIFYLSLISLLISTFFITKLYVKK